MIILHPCHIESINDGETHFIGVNDLLRLYGVARSRGHDWVSTDSLSYQRRTPEPGDWHLYPRANGNYFRVPRLPEESWYMPNPDHENTSHNDMMPEHQSDQPWRGPAAPLGVDEEGRLQEWMDSLPGSLSDPEPTPAANFVRVGPPGAPEDPEAERWQDHPQMQGGHAIALAGMALSSVSVPNFGSISANVHLPQFRSVFQDMAARLTDELGRSNRILGAEPSRRRTIQS